MVDTGPGVRELEQGMAELLEHGRKESVFPAASLWVAENLEPMFQVHIGGATETSLWDLASLTKPMSVVSLAMRLQAQGRLDLDERPMGCPVSIMQLLGHRSGLPAWWDLREVLDQGLPNWKVGSHETRAFIRSSIEAEIREGQHGACYSDLGYMLLGWLLEELVGESLDVQVPGYGVAPSEQHRVMSGGWCTYRSRELFGEVNDLNTHVLGGIAGHAGMFGQSEDVGLWALDLLRSYHGCGGSFDREIVRSYWSKSHFHDADTWVLGFDTPTPGNSSAGSLIGPNAVGHLGFTGTSVWIDPEPGRVVVLLTNRVAGPPEAQAAIKRFRPRLHDALFQALNGG